MGQTRAGRHRRYRPRADRLDAYQFDDWTRQSSANCCPRSTRDIAPRCQRNTSSERASVRALGDDLASPLSPPLIASPTPAATPITYVVVAGDTLARIASRYGVTVQAIVAANRLKDPSALRVGTVLILPIGPGYAPTWTRTPMTSTITPTFPTPGAIK